MKLKEVVSIKPISTVIDFQSSDKTLIDAYIVLEQTSKYFLRILEGISQRRDDETTALQGSIVPSRVSRCHKIRGTYGMGKSYFLLILQSMLASLNDKEMYKEIKKKFSDFSGITYQLETLYDQAKRYIIVNINGKDFVQLDFKSIIERQLHNKLVKELGADKLNFNSFYENTVKQLTEWREGDSPFYKVFIEKLGSDVDFTFEELIHGLQKRDRDAKEAYEKVYRSIMKQEPSNSFDSLKEFLSESDRIAKDNGYNGIVVIFDEFSSYLNGRAEIGLLNIDLSSIDILAESTEPSNGMQLHFIVSEHEDINLILEQNLSNMETVNKTAGRFSNYDLYFDRGSKLIENVMDINTNKYNRIKLDNIDTFNDYNENVDLHRLDDIYPINPYTLEYLVRISEKYAQGDRTLFSFIDERLRQFVEQEDVIQDNKLNLLGIDTVMDAFGVIIVRGREEFSKAYNSQLSGANTSLQKKVVKALALDYAVTITDTGKIKAGVKDSNLKYILSLNEEELKAAKEYLLKESNDAESYIVYNARLGGYELSPDTPGVNIEDEIRKLLPKTDEKRQLRNLIAERSSTLDVQIDYTIKKEVRKFPFDRYVNGKFVSSIGELKTLDLEKEHKDCSASARIIYYLPPAGVKYDYSTVLKTAEEKSKDFIDHKVAIAIPKEFTFAEDVSLLKRYEATKMLILDEKIMTNPKTSNQLRLEIVDLRTQIYNKLSAFGRSENFVFIFKDTRKDEVNSIDQLLESWLMDKLYPRFPKVEVEDFSTRNAANQLIKNLIVPRIAIGVDLDTNQVFGKQIRWSLKPLDLVQCKKTVDNYDVEIKKPEKNEITKEIFQIFAMPKEKLTLEEKYKKLTSSPYGLNDPMFETLFGIFLQTTDKFYLMDKQGSRASTTADTLKEVWNNYELVEVKDSIPHELKEDAVSILMLIDNIHDNNLLYKKLKPTMPSDDFGQHENVAIINTYMGTLKQSVEIFIKNLRLLSINNFFMEEMDTIKQDIEKTNNHLRPEDRLNAISTLIDKHFYNGVEIVEGQKIPTSRYVKFQNFMDNIKWLSNNVEDLNNQQKIIKELDLKTHEIKNDSLVTIVNDINKTMKAILSIDLVSTNWKDTKYEDNIPLERLKENTLEAINEYNNFYILNHNILNVAKEELTQAVNKYEFIPLIKELEHINFRGLSKLSEIKNQVHNVHTCHTTLNNDAGKLIQCSSCGELKELSQAKNDIEDKKGDITKNLGGIVHKNLEKLDDLYSLEKVKEEYEKGQTFDKFIAHNYPQLKDKAILLVSLLREDWVSSSDQIIELIAELYPIINEFIEESEDEVPEPEQKKSISLTNVISNISKKVKLSGYKNMTFTQFKNEFIKELNSIENEYDEIVIK